MKSKIIVSVVAALAMTSCATMGTSPFASGTAMAQPGTSGQPQSSTQSAATDILGSLLGTLIGNSVPVTEQSVVGTWRYASPEVRFESESLLTQAGGEVAAASIEKKLSEIYSQVGIVPGSCSFTFNQDKTCSIKMGAKTISGKYTIDPANNAINIVSTTGLIKINGKVYFGLNQLVLLFDSKKILTIAQTLATVTGQQNSTLGTLGSALSQYKGLMLGMNLAK